MTSKRKFRYWVEIDGRNGRQFLNMAADVFGSELTASCYVSHKIAMQTAQAMANNQANWGQESRDGIYVCHVANGLVRVPVFPTRGTPVRKDVETVDGWEVWDIGGTYDGKPWRVAACLNYRDACSKMWFAHIDRLAVEMRKLEAKAAQRELDALEG